MADCSIFFREFNQIVRLTKERRENLLNRREDLRGRIGGGYDILRTHNKLDYSLVFHSQGSFVMDTIINPSSKDDMYDIDDGVYFLGNMKRDDRPEPGTFHNWVINSVETGKSSFDFEKVTDKSTCVRVMYRSDDSEGFSYHVDIPIYYVRETDEPDLADKSIWWHESNPIEFILWFENLVGSGFKKEYILKQTDYLSEYKLWNDELYKNDHQLRRIVRYLKSWGDYRKEDMPPGIIMTILAGNNYIANERDDMSLRLTLENIQSYLDNNGFKCPRPTTPVGEDLFAKYSDTRKAYFKNALKSFVESSIKAIQSQNQKISCHEWKKHLGDRFPCSQAKDQKDYTFLSASASKSDMWTK